MNFVLLSQKNKDKSSEIFPPLILHSPYMCERAMPKGKIDQKKGSNCKEDDSAFQLYDLPAGMTGLTEAAQRPVRLPAYMPGLLI